MQATVASFDGVQGIAYTDDGVQIEFDALAFADHIRHLRIGQRIHLTVDPSSGRTARVSIF